MKYIHNIFGIYSLFIHFYFCSTNISYSPEFIDTLQSHQLYVFRLTKSHSVFFMNSLRTFFSNASNFRPPSLHRVQLTANNYNWHVRLTFLTQFVDHRKFVAYIGNTFLFARQASWPVFRPHLLPNAPQMLC